jgi:hypothetical protein
MRRNARARLERGQHDSQVVELQKGLSVVAGLPIRFTVELLEFSPEIELEIGPRCRLRVWPPLGRFVRCF